MSCLKNFYQKKKNITAITKTLIWKSISIYYCTTTYWVSYSKRIVQLNWRKLCWQINIYLHRRRKDQYRFHVSRNVNIPICLLQITYINEIHIGSFSFCIKLISFTLLHSWQFLLELIKIVHWCRVFKHETETERAVFNNFCVMSHADVPHQCFTCTD